MRFLLLLCLTLTASFAVGIEADQTRLKEYQLLTITHEKGEVIYATFNYTNPDGTVERRVLDDEHFKRGETQTIMTGPPAMYEITIGKPLFIEIVREGRPNPNPSPSPQPRPDPTPGPDPMPEPEPSPEPEPQPEPDNKIAVKSVYFFEEQQDRGLFVDETNVITNKSFRDRMAALNIRVIVLDDDLENVRPWLDKIGDNMPAVLFYEDKTKYAIHPVPKSLSEMNSLFDKVNK